MRRWCPGFRDLPKDWYQPGDLLQLEKEVCGSVTGRDARLKALEAENSRLKKIVADLTLDREMLQDVIRRKL